MAGTRTAVRTIVALAAVLATACSGGGDAIVETTATASDVAGGTAPPATIAPTGTTPPATPTATDAPAAAVPEALDFTAPAVAGGQVVGAEFVGEAVALWFWAPW
ncbi:MAG: hypothetical protein KY469_00970 [Actinobacteria bacterium]|nr:hypothetical protein [Actinomycetota bacterium]